MMGDSAAENARSVAIQYKIQAAEATEPDRTMLLYRAKRANDRAVAIEDKEREERI